MGARRRIALVAVVLLAGLATGCSAPPDPTAWTLEPIPFTPGGGSQPTDLAYAQATLAADGSGGFWGVSSTTWLHVSADAETLAHFNIEVGTPGAQPAMLAPLSTTELLTADRDPSTGFGARLGVLDARGMTWSGVAATADGDGFASIAGIAAHDRDALVALMRVAAPHTTGPAALTLNLVRIGLDDGSRALLHTEPIAVAPSDTKLFGATTAIDALPDGTILFATPNGLSLLAADGTELDRIPSAGQTPIVSVGAAGAALWWGYRTDLPEPSSPATARFRVHGGSAQARDSIERASTCTDGRRLRLVSTTGGALRESDRLPFLCGARAATWTGSSWVVAIGGEGDGVLVRVTPPRRAS